MPEIYSIKEIVGDDRSATFAVADQENRVRVYDAREGRLRAEFPPDKRAAWGGLGGVDQKRLYASAMINTGMYAYDMEAANVPIWRERSLTSSYCVQSDPKSERLLAGGYGRPLRVLDATTGETLFRVNGAQLGAFVPGSSDLVVGGKDWFGLIDGVTGKRRWRKKSGSSIGQAVAASADAIFVAVVGETFYEIESDYRSVEIRASGVVCFDLEGRLRWMKECPPHRFYNDLAFRPSTGEVVGYRSAANADDFHLVTLSDQGDVVAEHPFPRLACLKIFDEGRLYATSEGQVRDTLTHELVFQFAQPPHRFGLSKG